MSNMFYPGDKVTFEDWLTKTMVTGTIFNTYRILDKRYLLVKTDDGCTYQPEETRCTLAPRIYQVD
mgnify:CR=1 FL=1